MVGAFYDLDISKAFVDFNSPLGLFFASFGQLPSWILIEFCGVILIKALKDNVEKYLRIIGWLLGIVLIVVGTYMIYSCEHSRWNGLNAYLPNYVELIIALILGGAIFVGAWFFVNSHNKGLMIRVVIIISVTICLELAITNIMKILWGRPRYRLIYGGGVFENTYYSVEDLFNNWYELGTGIAKTVFSNTSADNFKSFPSGHTSGATNGLLFFLLPLLNAKLATKRWSQYLFFSIGLVWFVLVGIFRIRYGAHYLSDVSMGAFVSVIIGFVVCEIVPRIKPMEIENDKVS